MMNSLIHGVNQLLKKFPTDGDILVANHLVLDLLQELKASNQWQATKQRPSVAQRALNFMIPVAYDLDSSKRDEDASVGGRNVEQKFLATLGDVYRRVDRNSSASVVDWVKIIVLELVLVKIWVCDALDKCSEHLAFWKDLALQPERLYVLKLTGCEFPTVNVLEHVMLYLIGYLGKTEKLLLRLREGRIQMETQLESFLYDGIRIIVALQGLNVPNEQFGFIKIQIPHIHRQLYLFLNHTKQTIDSFVTQQIRVGHYPIPSTWRLYWPEIGLLACCGFYTLHMVASGALQVWLETASISRKFTRGPGTVTNVTRATQDSPSLWTVLFSLENVKNLFFQWKDKASRWLNKKFLQHVTTPTKNLINELINHKELELEIELFNEMDALELRECEALLETMFAEQFANRMELPPQVVKRLSEGKTRLDGNALALVTPEYEHIVRKPLLLLTPGSVSARPILINIYYIKAEILYILRALDFLVKRNNFNFEMLAATPAILTANILFRKLYKALFGKSKAHNRSAFVVAQRIRFIFRDIEHLLNQYDDQDEDHVGRYVLLVHQLQNTLETYLLDNLTNSERTRIFTILDLVHDPFSGKTMFHLLQMNKVLDAL